LDHRSNAKIVVVEFRITSPSS